MNADKYLPTIQHFIARATKIHLLHTYEQIEYDGIFYYFTVDAPDVIQRTVCLLESYSVYADPLEQGGTFPLLEGVEEGYGYAVVGCYDTEGNIIKVNTETKIVPDILRYDERDAHYYLYLLAK